jgi:hypothetical protein
MAASFMGQQIGGPASDSDESTYRISITAKIPAIELRPAIFKKTVLNSDVSTSQDYYHYFTADIR